MLCQSQLTYNCHQRVEISDIDALFGNVDKILDHTNAISFLHLLKTTNGNQKKAAAVVEKWTT